MDGINYSRDHFLAVTCRIDDKKKPYHKLNIEMNFVEETHFLLAFLYSQTVDRSLSPFESRDTPISITAFQSIFRPSTNNYTSFSDRDFKILSLNRS